MICVKQSKGAPDGGACPFRLPKTLWGFRILVVLGGLYSNARHKACESNEADRYRVMAAPPLVCRKDHAGSGDQQRHKDDHGFGRCRFTCAPSASRGHADERAGDPLHGGRIDAKASGDLADAVAGILASFQSRTDATLNVGR